MKIAKYKQLNLRSLVARNARAFRDRGLNSADLFFLDKLVSLARGRNSLVNTIAGVGRVCGMSRQGAHQRWKRLEAAGLVYRLYKVIYFNIKGMARMAAEAVKKRLAHVSRSKHLKKLAKVNGVRTYIQKQIIRKGRGMYQTAEQFDYKYQQAKISNENKENEHLRAMGLKTAPKWLTPAEIAAGSARRRAAYG